MPAVKAEFAYLDSRLTASIRQGEHAAGRCSKASHEGMAKLYRCRIAELSLTGTADAIALPAHHAKVIDRQILLTV